MRIVKILVLCLLFTFSLFAKGGHSSYSSSYGSHSSKSSSDVYVHGYTKKDGTYVSPYMKTSPNDTKTDNFSTKGNINPYTGKEGTKDPY